MKVIASFVVAFVTVSSVAHADELDQWTQHNVTGAAGVAVRDGHWVTRGASSTDGLTWTTQATTIPVHVTKANGLYVAADSMLMTSTDGTQWQPQMPGWAPGYRRAAFGAGVWIVATSSGSHAASADGTAWSLRPAPPGAGGIHDVVFVAGQFVAATDAGVWTSADGLRWTQRANGAPVRSVTYANGRFVAVGQGTTLASTDGITWTVRPTFVDLQAVAYGGGTFVAAGVMPSMGKTYLATSTDGVTWTARTPLPFAGATVEMAYSAGRFVVAIGTTVGATFFTSALPEKVSVTPTGTMTAPTPIAAPKVGP